MPEKNHKIALRDLYDLAAPHEEDVFVIASNSGVDGSYRSANVAGGDDHNRVLEARCAGRIA